MSFIYLMKCTYKAVKLNPPRIIFFLMTKLNSGKKLGNPLFSLNIDS